MPKNKLKKDILFKIVGLGFLLWIYKRDLISESDLDYLTKRIEKISKESFNNDDFTVIAVDEIKGVFTFDLTAFDEDQVCEVFEATYPDSEIIKIINY